MKKLILSIALLGSAVTYNAQETELQSTDLTVTHLDSIPEGWTKGGLFNLSFSQVSLSNWVGGGQDAITLNGLLSIYANQRKGIRTWENSLTLGYGVTKQGDLGFIKNDDRVDLTSKLGRRINNSNWYLAAVGNFRTQMFDGFTAPGDANRISTFMAPGYLTVALGLDYKPNANFSFLIAPITSKNTIVRDDALAAVGAFGVDPGSNFRSEFGGLIRAEYTKAEILKNVDFSTKVDMFSNYLESPDHIDVNWETIIGMRVNKYITVMLSELLIYDHDINIAAPDAPNGFGPRAQFKQVFGVGFAYSF